MQGLFRKWRSQLRIVVMGVAIALWLLISGGAASQLPAPLLDPYLTSGKLAEGEATFSKRLSDVPNDDKSRFSLGIIQTLRSVERLSQSLYKYGLREQHSTLRSLLPFFRFPIPDNPNPAVLRYEDMQKIFQTIVDDLAQIRTTLEPISDRKVKIPLRLGLAKLDLDGDGKATDEETLWSVFATFTNRNIDETTAQQFLIAVDYGDVLWLRGYTHVLASIGEVLLAYDRRDIFSAGAHVFFTKVDSPYKFLQEPPLNSENYFDLSEFFDLIALLHLIHFPVVEPQRLTVALNHLQAMGKLSRESWQAIQAETDNDHEWLPNPKQQGVIPNLSVNQEMINSWFSFIDEADQLLDGKKLVPFWRGNQKLGINLKRVFTEPTTLDAALWVQGTAATPYLERGKLTDGSVWNRLFRVFRGDFLAFALWFN